MLYGWSLNICFSAFEWMNLYIPLDMTGSERSHGSHSYVCKLHTQRPTCKLIFRTQRRTQSDKKWLLKRFIQVYEGRYFLLDSTLYFSLMTFMNVKKKILHTLHIIWRQQIKLWHLFPEALCLSRKLEEIFLFCIESFLTIFVFPSPVRRCHLWIAP